MKYYFLSSIYIQCILPIIVLINLHNHIYLNSLCFVICQCSTRRPGCCGESYLLFNLTCRFMKVVCVKNFLEIRDQTLAARLFPESNNNSSEYEFFGTYMSWSWNFKVGFWHAFRFLMPRWLLHVYFHNLAISKLNIVGLCGLSQESTDRDFKAYFWGASKSAERGFEDPCAKFGDIFEPLFVRFLEGPEDEGWCFCQLFGVVVWGLIRMNHVVILACPNKWRVWRHHPWSVTFVI